MLKGTFKKHVRSRFPSFDISALGELVWSGKVTQFTQVSLSRFIWLKFRFIDALTVQERSDFWYDLEVN